MPAQISVKIDGELCTAAEGQTLFEVAEANGKFIPSLCRLEGVSAAGSCRLCLVEVSGVDRLLPACTTPAQRGMAVATTSDRLNSSSAPGGGAAARSSATTSARSACPTAIASCRLWRKRLGVTHVRYPYNSPRLPVDMSHPRFVLDHNRCILCSRCVRVCDEIEGAHVWDIGGRGIGSRVVAELSKPWANRAPARVAASACRSAPPAPWSRRAMQSRR